MPVNKIRDKSTRGNGVDFFIKKIFMLLLH